MTALVKGRRPGPHLIGELRQRGGWSLIGFDVRREGTGPEGTTVSGVIPAATLERLQPGLFDISLSLVAGRDRHVTRLRVEESPDLPHRWGDLALYRTRAGHLTLKRATGRPLVTPRESVTGVDQRTCGAPLAELVPAVCAQVRRSGALGAGDPAYYFPTTMRASFDTLFPGLEVTVVMDAHGSGWRLSVLGRDRSSQRFLRNVLVNRARMISEHGDQLHVVAESGQRPGPDATIVVEHLAQLLDRFRLFLDAGPRPEDVGLVPAHWWDVKANFGDVLGPMLVEGISGRSAINVRAFRSEDPGLFTVGSVAAHLQRPGARVWGSGVIGTLSRSKVEDLAPRRPRSIHAVRGSLTRTELRDKLGWEVPEVYGDPALLLPRYYEPQVSAHTQGRIALVPHYMHRGMVSPSLPEEIAVVDVQQGPEIVIDQITSARACISSSLHGLVVAQAYDVPWSWLRVGDKLLHGDSFKFEDFFTTLDRDLVRELDVPTGSVEADALLRSAARATVPTSRFDEESLLSAFPEL
ncbi:polysaccharide pyruvyl transferase family protein [Ornithinimicrobium sp. LYQ92]|uniref:polysaccharide pyruvyl transferase family protein n=1 Tax=Serinicoccus sp. LYQ92 TaxID=3378798 RepID=UPI00385347CF